MKLNLRQQDILRATVRHYINTAEPVGSKSLAQAYDLQISSATIRNVMSALEGSGLLYQPHTSAGRIPSDSGYRTYVDKLMVLPESLHEKMAATLHHQRTDRSRQATEVLLKESAQLLSRLSGYIALITLPQTAASIIKHLQLVRVGEQQALLIVIDVYNNHSVLLSLPLTHSDSQSSLESIDRELQILSNFLTEQLSGRSLHDAVLDWSDLDHAFQRYADTLTQAIATLCRQTRTPTATQILVSGVAEALNQPEFSERQQIRSLVQLLEDDRDQLLPLIVGGGTSSDHESETTDSEATHQQRLRIWIGAENPIGPMQACALVATQYGKAPGPVGNLGVLGPTRMLYENAIAAVEAAADYLTEAVAPLGSTSLQTEG